MSAVERILEPSFSQEQASECVAFARDDESRTVIETVVKQFFAHVSVEDGGSEEAMNYLSESTAPKIIIVDISESSAPLTAMLSLTAAFTEETQLIGIGSVNDINLYREIVGAGVADYLIKPLTEKSLSAALRRAQETPATPGENRSNKAAANNAEKITVIGSRGGIGASTVAVNLAWIMGMERKVKTTLVDLDLEFGTVALSLDLEPTRGLREALESPARVDSLFLESATARLTDNFAVMATEETLTGDNEFNPEAIEVIFEMLGSQDAVVLDLPRTIGYAMRNRAFAASSRIVLVTDISLAGLRDSLRLLGEIDSAAKGVPVTVIATQTGGPKQAMPIKDFAKALGHKIDFQMPDEPKAVAEATNNGKPIAQQAKRSKTSKALHVVVENLLEKSEESAERGKPSKGKAEKVKKEKKSLLSMFKRG